eukprot:343321-Chlamydomonas_euryale.AAC.2
MQACPPPSHHTTRPTLARQKHAHACVHACSTPATCLHPNTWAHAPNAPSHASLPQPAPSTPTPDAPPPHTHKPPTLSHLHMMPSSPH